MLGLFQSLFNSAPFIPHGHCYLWKPGLVWLHASSDVLIAIAYYSIPTQLFIIIHKRRDFPFHWMVWLFGAFIIACGTTHLMEVWTLWTPTYWLAGLLKLVAAAISLYTAAMLLPLIPQVLTLPSPAQVEATNQTLKRQILESQQVKQVLQESEERFRSAFNSAAIGMALVCFEGQWLQVNYALCEMLGYSKPELLMTRPETITHPDDRYMTAYALEQLLKGERNYQLQKRYFHKQGHIIWVLLNLSLVRNIQGQPLHLIAQIQDITARTQAEQALELQSLITKNMVEGVGLIRASDGIFVYTNPKFEEMFGYEVGELAGKHVSIVNYEAQPGGAEQVANQIRQTLVEQSEASYEVQNVRKDGTPFWCRAHTSTFEHPEHGLVHVAVHEDITQRKQAEQAQREIERRFRAIFDQTFQFVGLLKPDGTLLEANQTILEFGGIQLADIVNRPFWEARWWTISEATQTQLKAAIAQAAAGEFVRYEVNVRGAGETVATIDFSLKPLKDETGAVVLLIPEGRDISDRKQAEQAKASLEEKEVLLQEIHHRVKNNLQIISSLLNLQSKYIKDPATLEVFKESQERVRSMALIHEKLYQSEDLAQIDFAEYIQSLTANLFRSYAVKAQPIALKLEVSPVSLNVDTAIPCGLIINELVTNSLKHAFPTAQTGEIFIQFYADADHRLTLIIGDNGIGLPQGLNLKTIRSLGLQLVFNLTKQLKGTIDISHQQGVLFKITFNELNPRNKG
ncbi:PAS domain S-box protein [Phormidium tenue FACHB-886]|nr:PAS domain S-box protein [Phormidium tenue FACHB-886]